ncbi:tandem-type lipoprotein [Staphylococcus hyicus]|uniref:tandem-type lipoprotein n=1 Tax=Staphylococcus hyicus TaxID=1284 RepID=UPI00217DCB37|nr:tandem-type lipoprotein [Staphylococcus hyicus]UWF57068.1 tandem-type lipoprotein [Staphylococcus hyicus]
MKIARSIVLIIGLMMSIGILSSCDITTRQKIESGLKEPLSVYPTKNLEDFYDKEGYRDSNFSKDDKGVWSVYTVVSKRNDEGKMKREGVMLYIDRNTRSSEGYYFVDNESEDTHNNYKKEYPIVMKNNQLFLKDNDVDEDIKRKVKHFKFFVQFGRLKDLGQYKEADASYNSQAPNYSIIYSLNKKDKNLKEIQNQYDLKVGKKPFLEISGDGDFKSDAFKSNSIDYTLDDNIDRYYSSVVSYKPKRGMTHE